MGNNNETTTKFKVDISELKKAMQDAKRQVAIANSEFKAASSSMDDWTKSSDGLSAKLKQLDNNLKSQKTILKSLEDQYELTVREMGEGSKAAEDLRIKINNQKAVINNVEREIANYESTLSDVSDAEAKAAKTGKSVADILDETSNNAEDAGDGFTTLKGAVATFTGNVLTSLVSGLKDAASNLLGLADSTREYRGQMSKLESASTEAGYGVDYAKDKYMDLYGVLANETATTTAVNNLMAIGAEEDTLNSLLNSSIGIWSKYGDSISLDGLAEAINHTSKLGEVQGNLADALEWSGITVDDFNDQLAKCGTEQERQELIAQTLDGLYGDLSKSYQENNASIIEANKANAEYNDTVADIGKKIEPVTTKIKEGFNDVLEKILELIGDGDLSSWTGKIEDGFTVVTDEILPAIKDGLKWIIDNKNVLLAGIAAIAAGMLAWNVTAIITSVVTAIKGWIVATEGMTVAQRLLNLVMNANPIGIIITAISALVAAFIVLWNTSDEFREFWIDLWQKIQDVADMVVKAVIGFFTNCWESIKEAWDKAKPYFTLIWNNIKVIFSVVQAVLSGFFKNAWEGIKKIWNAATGFFKQIWETIKGIFSVVKSVLTGNWRDAWEGIKNIVNGWKNYFSNVWKDIKGVFSNVKAFFSETFKNAWTAVKNAFNGWGDFFGGLWTKIKDKFSDIGTSIGSAISDTVKEGINGIISTIESTINSGIGLINGAIDIINKIPNVSVDKIAELSLPRLAKGGITMGATLAEIGEAGREAVLPLERNTGWMRGLARDLVNEMRLGTASVTVDKNNNAGVVNNFTQNNYSPKPLNRLEIYRDTKNILGLAGGV